MSEAVTAIIVAGMDAVKAIVQSVENAKAGQPIDPTVISAAVTAFQQSIAANNAAADAALAAKFPGQ